MRTGLLVAAAPAVAAVGYALLTGYLLNRVKPLPISVMPWPDEKSNRRVSPSPAKPSSPKPLRPRPGTTIRPSQHRSATIVVARL